MNLEKSLEFPLDIETILRKKKAIKREFEVTKPILEKNIAILGGSTTAEIKNILELFLLKKGVKASFYESEYDQYYQEALFENPALVEFKPDIIYIHTTHININHFPSINDSEDTVQSLLEQEKFKFQSMWDALGRYDCAIIQNNFDLPPDRSLGNLDFSEVQGKTNFINRLNLFVADQARKTNNLYINDINYVSSSIGINSWFDRSLWYQAKYALSYEAIPPLAFNLSNIISAIFGLTKKCLVLDLDNTLWGGIIGDDGLHGITIGKETALGEAHVDFQRYVTELKQRGIPLAVCSKNDEAIAREGLGHQDNVLSCDDMTVIKANWEPKYQNIRKIAEEINIHPDSLVFFDDNPVERDVVVNQMQEVTVPDIGNDIVQYIDYLDTNGYFETVHLTGDDKQRTAYYQNDKHRITAQASFENYHDFLYSLEMEAEIKPFQPLYLERITQLINKTNQFNLTTKRYTLGEVNAVFQDSQHLTLYGRLTDKFGDNGLIAITIGTIKNQQCHIDLWLMSCRVLKRDMELAMLDSLVIKCLERGLTEIIGYYYKSPKNSMVSHLYEQMGFNCIEQNQDNSVWQLQLDNYNNLNTTIKVNND
jgi:FkbH-like protein